MQKRILRPFKKPNHNPNLTLTNVTNPNLNPNKNLDQGVQKRIIHPFTNGTNMEQDLRV